MVLSTWCRTFMYTWEKKVFLPEMPSFFLAPAPQEGPQHTEQQNELNTCEHKNQDATKITSAFADSRIPFCWSVMTMFGENVVSVLDSYVFFS